MSTITTICDCCGEHEAMQEAIENGHELCESCATTDGCDFCDSCYNDSHYVWECFECESCKKSRIQSEWMEQAREVIEREMAAQGATGPYYEGRKVEIWHRAADSLSWYADFCVATGEVDEDGDEIESAISVRVSDHYGRGSGHINMVYGYASQDEIAQLVADAITKMRDKHNA